MKIINISESGGEKKKRRKTKSGRMNKRRSENIELMATKRKLPVGKGVNQQWRNESNIKMAAAL